ncbi:hypothetical protein TgHK011_007604 [Trichoderma gracile]|nr:hypothetical protein TgHK011_007604 [Trichoderma gracile]
MPPNQIATPSATAMVLAEKSIAPYGHCASGDERPQAPNLRHPDAAKEVLVSVGLVTSSGHSKAHRRS